MNYFFEICGKEEDDDDDDDDDGFISEMLCVLWFCLFHNCSSFVLFWRPKHSKHSQKKKTRKKEKHNRVVGLGQNPLQLACFAPDFPSTGPRKT